MLPITEMIVPQSRYWAAAIEGFSYVEWTLPGIPGFRPTHITPPTCPDGASCRVAQPYVSHRDGWRTRTQRALPLPSPAWDQDARAWDIAEGVYHAYPDGPCRLAWRRDYYAFARGAGEARMLARMGGEVVVLDRPLPEDAGLSVSRGGGNSLGAYQIDGDCLRHPEHGDLRLPADWQCVAYLPGWPIGDPRGVRQAGSKEEQ
jgi:hypothetical protein